MSNSVKKTSGLITLQGIVGNVQNDIGDYRPTEELRLLQFAIRGYKEARLFALKDVYETEWITMTSINTITLPEDYVSFVSLGVPYAGRLWTFTKEGRLIPPVTEEDGEAVLSNDRQEDAVLGDGGFIGGYGVSGGRNEYYMRIDQEHNRIILNGFSRTEVLLTYQSTGINISGETYIARMAEEAIIAFVHWKRKQHSINPKFHMWEIREAKGDYDIELEKLKHLQAPTLDEWYDAIYSAWMQAPKR